MEVKNRTNMHRISITFLLRHTQQEMQVSNTYHYRPVAVLRATDQML